MHIEKLAGLFLMIGSAFLLSVSIGAIEYIKGSNMDIEEDKEKTLAHLRHYISKYQRQNPVSPLEMEVLLKFQNILDVHSDTTYGTV